MEETPASCVFALSLVQMFTLPLSTYLLSPTIPAESRSPVAIDGPRTFTDTDRHCACVQPPETPCSSGGVHQGLPTLNLLILVFALRMGDVC